MYKVILSWDIKDNFDQEYFEFMVREFAPRITALGLTPTEAWFSVYGDGPQVIVECVSDDLEATRKILKSQEWDALYQRLLHFVTNYKQKIIIGRPDLQI